MGSWPSGARSVALALTASSWGALACGNPGTPGGQGNEVINDTRDAEARPPANPTPDDGSVPAGQPDGSFSDGPAVSYPGITACDTCVCSAANAYCFGGATGRLSMLTPDLKSDGGGDAGLPACPIAAGASPTVGCNALPAGCTDCACVILGLQPAFACYLVCAFDGQQMSVYCPNP